MNQTEREQMLDAFKNALLYKKEDKCSRIQKDLEKELSEGELNDYLKAAKEWVNQASILGENAVALAKSGKDRDSLEFDDLKKEAKALGGNVITYLYQIFDETIISLENENVIAEKKEDLGVTKEKRPLKFLLGEITQLSTWGKKYRGKLQAYLNEIKECYPDSLPEAEKRKAHGEKLVHYKTLAVNMSQNDLEGLLKKMSREGFNSYEQSIIRKMRDKVNFKKQIKKNNKTNSFVTQVPKVDQNQKQQHVSEYVVSVQEIPFTNIHRNSIPELAPTAEWTILFDETGSDFNERAFDEGVSDISLGRMVAIVVPDYTALPPCNSHSVDLPISEVHALQQTLLSHKCGVIGLPVNAFYRIHAELWFSCIETLLDLILRLLPLNGKTKLKIFAEQRGKATPQNEFLLKKTCDDCLFHLSRAFPERSQSIEIESHIIRKVDHPWNGYVDAVAFSWSSPNGKLILNESGWEYSCLIDSSPYFLRHCIDVMEREDCIAAGDWDKLLSLSMDHTNSLEKSLLKNLGERAQNNPFIWKGYLDYTVLHLSSKAIDLDLLGRQLNWLSQYTPQENELPPKLRLLWLTVKLAEENHRGCVASHPAQREEFLRLSDSLFEEDAPLTCNAALNLAVSYTDEFNFKRAKDLLLPWKAHRPEVPGLMYYGRILSSLGQHEAFLGNNTEAVSCFKQAINAFSRLSDSAGAFLDIQQTSAYLLTALMDTLPDTSVEFYKEAEKYFGGTICDVAPQLGASIEKGRKYHHHILLRYLTTAASTIEERNAYLSSKDKWQINSGHPWEMIEFYRSILVESSKEKLKHLQTALDIAMTGEGTMHVIAAVILGAILLIQPEKETDYLKLVNQLAVEIPTLDDRLRILREHINMKYQPLELASRVLPFNFR